LLGHDVVRHSAQPATCTQNGWYAYDLCTRCGSTTYEEIPAKGHSLGALKTVTPATCTEDGEERRKCTRCDYSETYTVTASGHTLGEWEEIQASTCFEKQISRRVCNSCDYEEIMEGAYLIHQDENRDGACDLCGTISAEDTTAAEQETESAPNSEHESESTPADAIVPAPFDPTVPLCIGGAILLIAALLGGLLVFLRKRKNTHPS
jgi:hypothetical protein